MRVYSPPQPAAVGGRLSEFVEGWKLITSDPYVLSIVAKGYRQGVQIDLQDAYFHVPIHPSSRKYLRFAFENKVYQFWVLPFGLNTVPQIFTHLGHMVTGYLHRLGISVVPYLDDWLIQFCSKRKEIRAGSSARYQFLGIRLSLVLSLWVVCT